MAKTETDYILRSSDYTPKEPSSLPSVSLCIPTLNDGETLDRSLSSMRQLDYPSLEIIVIDGHSDDETVAIAEEYADTVIFDDNNYGSACQQGFKESSGEIVGLFDGDIYFPHSSWLKNAVGYFKCGDRVSTVWPKNVAPPESGALTKLYFNHWQIIMDNRMETGRGYFGGGNALFDRNALEEIGGIDSSVHWGADFDWAKRLHESGYQVVYLEDPVQHHTMRTWNQFYSKQFSGAETFSKKGFGLMGMSIYDAMYEQYVLGSLGMARGLLSDQDPAWLLYPPYMLLRSIAYGSTFFRNILGDVV